MLLGGEFAVHTGSQRPVSHAGDHSAVAGDRVFHRGMVATDGFVVDASEDVG